MPEQTSGGHRRYDPAKLKPEMFRTTGEARTTLYGSHSCKNQKLLDGVKKAVEASQSHA